MTDLKERDEREELFGNMPVAEQTVKSFDSGLDCVSSVKRRYRRTSLHDGLFKFKRSFQFMNNVIQ
jgi:hypothetical protein